MLEIRDLSLPVTVLLHRLDGIPWPMALAPTNEAIRGESYAGKNLVIGETITVMIQDVI